MELIVLRIFAVKSVLFIIMLISSPLTQFEVSSIINFNLNSFDISISNSVLSMIIAVFFFLFIIETALTDATIIPNRWQSGIELIFEFIHNLIQEQIGDKGFKYLPFIFTLFVFILFCNVLGMIPYNFTATSQVVITLALSITIFIGVTIIGFYIHGLHFFKLFAPSGIPVALAPLIIVIEIVSYLTRSVSLGVRLVANMFAGHTLLNIMSTFAWQMLAVGGLVAVASIAPLALVFALTGLELLVAVLQAYVFTVLTCSYLNDAINLH